MSISNGIFTAGDGTEIRVSSVMLVGPVVGDNGGGHYEIIYPGGHINIEQGYMARDDFLTVWRLT